MDQETSGKQGSGLTIGATAVVVALGATLLGGRASTPPAPSPGPAQAVHVVPESERTEPSAAGADAGKIRVAELLEEYYAQPAGDPTAAGDARLDAARKFWPPEGRVLVADVADPLESRVGYTLDQEIDAIIAAAVDAGYSLNSFRLPWRVGGEPAQYRWMAKAGDPGSGSSTWEIPKSPGRSEPGALLFARAFADAPLLVLLAGETPTSGVRVPAFAAALDIAHTLNPTKTVIVGPAYSGGARSMIAAVDKWRANNAPWLSIDIVSGTLTSDDAACQLRTFADKSGGGVRFVPLDVPVSWTRDTMLKFVDDHQFLKPGTSSVALLVELETAFGAGSAPPSSNEERPCGSLIQASGTPPTVIKYPLHIAQARSAYDKQGRDGGRIRSLEAKEALDLPMGFVRDGADTPPTFLPDNAANVSERLLAQSLEALEQLHYKFVGIVGTDAYDRIFLARMVHRFIPNAQLFMLASDVLYLHPSYTADLLGMWVASSDPADPAALSAIEPGGEFVIRSSSDVGASGVRRALLWAISDGQPDARKITGAGFAAGTWISVVGRDSFWPVKFEPARDDPTVDDFQGHPRAEQREPDPKIWAQRPLRQGELWAPLGFGGALLFGLAWFVVVARKLDGRTDWRVRALGTCPCLARLFCTSWPQLPESLRTVLGDGQEPTDYLSRFAMLVLPPCLLLYWLSFVWPILFFAQWPLLLTTAVACASLVVLVATVLLWIKESFSADEDSPGSRKLAAATAARAAVVLIVIWTPLRLSLENPDVASWFRFEQATTLGSGLSPIVVSGLLTAALLVLVVAAAQRSRLRCYKSAVRKVFGGEPTSRNRFYEMRCTGIQVLERFEVPATLQALAHRFWFPATIAILFGVLVAIRHTTSVEGPRFDVAVLTGISLVVLAVTDGWLQFYLLWQTLRRFLRATAATPLVAAFRDLPADFGHTFGLRLSERPLSITQLSESMDKLAQLVHAISGEEDARSLHTALDGARTTLAKMSKEDAEILAMHPFTFATLQGAQLAEAAGAILDRRPADLELWQTRKPRELAEAFVAMELTRFISYVFSVLKNRALSCTVAIALLLLAVASYPIQPQYRLVSLTFLGVAVTAIAVLRVVVEVDRDALLSSIAKRDPNKVNFDRDFFGMVATYAGIPAVSLLVTGLPALTQQLSDLLSWSGH